MKVVAYTGIVKGITITKGKVMAMRTAVNATINRSAVEEKLTVSLAKGSSEIEQALRLRYKVFVEEENNHKLVHASGMESDAFDEACDHLIVKSERTGEVVGTYRLLPGSRTSGQQGFYSETEFDLTGLAHMRPEILELGRSCVDFSYRDGRVISRLWEGIASYSQEHGYRYLTGCASLHPTAPNDLNEIYSLLLARNIITARYGIRPLPSHTIESLQWLEIAGREQEITRKLPPLMRGYQRLGAEIGGDPAYDEVFDTVDFFIMLETSRVARRYKRHYLER